MRPPCFPICPTPPRSSARSSRTDRMLEVELKSVVDDVDRCRVAVERAGATLVYTGRLEDRRWDTYDRAMAARDHVLRVRVYRDSDQVRASLDWKGPTRRDGTYKLREELA